MQAAYPHRVARSNSVSVTMRGMRVEPARLAVLVFQRVGSNDALPCADAADPADANPTVTDHVLFDDEPLLAVITLDDARRAITKLRVYVVVPQIERLEDMAIGVDHVISAGHQHALRVQSDAASC